MDEEVKVLYHKMLFYICLDSRHLLQDWFDLIYGLDSDNRQKAVLPCQSERTYNTHNTIQNTDIKYINIHIIIVLNYIQQEEQ